ncbi:MAG TPA: radical SAM protein [Gaiellaceae bacterium]|nr:radical SAM protein [Gaiellaceae bacterium]
MEPGTPAHATRNGTPPLPKELQVEVTGACNLACRMCLVSYRPKLGKAQGAMSFELFKEVVDELPELEKLTVQGLGEPLLAPDLFRMVEYVAARGVRVGFNTNGTLLTEERAERLVHAGLDWLHVSLDGATPETYERIRRGSSFATVERNVRGLVHVLRRLRAERPVLSLVFVAMRRNLCELPDLVRLAAEWEVGRLFVQNLSHSFDDTDPSGAYSGIRDYALEEALWGDDDHAEAEAVFAEARAVAGELGVELRLPRLAEPPRRPREPGAPGCHWPFESAYLAHDGQVQPCCMVMGSDRAVLGDAGEQRFSSVWAGGAYRDFREGLLGDEPPAVCQGCSLYRGVF